jgi:hypothetical protein
MIFEKFKQLIARNPFPIERIVPLDKFIYFIKETQKTGVLPEITKQEFISIRNYIINDKGKELVELRDEVLEEIKVNVVSIPQENLKKYIIYMEEKLEPILTCMDEFNLFSLIRTENLYPIPLSYSDKDLLNGNTFDESRKLYAVPLSKMKNYTDDERGIYRSLERLFELNMHYCRHFYEVKYAIDEINPSKESDLSAFELALKHYRLFLAKKENLTSKEVVEIYRGFKNSKNIEQAYNDLIAGRKKGNQSQLKRVSDSLSEFPDVQKAIQNDIDNLN